MASTLPLNQLDPNLFTSRLGFRRLSMSSMVSTISCTTNPNSPTPHTPKSAGASSPTGFDENSFGEDHMRYQERKPPYGHSIAPNLLSINTHDSHDANTLGGYHSHEDIQSHQVGYMDQVLSQPQPQCNQHSVLRCQDRISPFIDCSSSFNSWESEYASRAVELSFQCTKGQEYEEEPMSDDDSNRSSSSILSYMSPARRRPSCRRRAPRRTETDLPLVVSNSDQPHVCPIPGCIKRFKRQEHLRRHERTHTAERPFPCDVKACGKRFSRTDNLRAHRRTHMKQGGRNVFVPGLEVM